MARVVALYRHPIKGLTPERRDSITVRADGRIEGDRVLAFRFADAATPEERDGFDYWPKAKGLALQDFPALAALRTSYDDSSRLVRIEHQGAVLVEATITPEGRSELSAALTDFLLATPEGRRLRRPGRLPLVLVGDGKTSRFQDRPRGYVSVHSRGSVRELGDAIGQGIDDRRFRSNIIVDDIAPWAELDWAGEVRIGDVVFQAAGPIVRCLATHANPDTGVRDAKVLTTLTGTLAQPEPILGRLLLPGWASAEPSDAQGGRVIRVDDEVHAG